MTKFTGVPQQTGAEDLSLSHRTRYGLYLAPSEELSELIANFYTSSALNKIGDRPFRLGVAQKTIDIVRNSPKENVALEAEISTYSRLIKKYELGMQFRLRSDGFVYTQERSNRGAVTRLLFRIAASQVIRDEIMKPPFFEFNTQAPLQASIMLPSSDVVPNADYQAQEIEGNLRADHPSAINGMAQFAYYLAGLQVVGREIPAPILLRPAESNKN